jgi:hypothetical protein
MFRHLNSRQNNIIRTPKEIIEAKFIYLGATLENENDIHFKITTD